jgi:hypothetical protein
LRILAFKRSAKEALTSNFVIPMAGALLSMGVQ